MQCLESLAEGLGALLPACPTGNLCRKVVDVSAGCVQLAHLPTGDVNIVSACGQSIDADNYLIDYTSGTLYAFCVADKKVLISYSYNLAATYVQMAVRDLGVRLPQRNTVCTPLFAHCGAAPLPCAVQRIDSIRVSDCTCGRPTCQKCLRIPLCACKEGLHFECGPCGLYQRDGMLIVNPPPCEDKMLHLCYVGGYPLDKNGCFVGLSAELADLVLLKAQALAYSNPRLLFDLAGISSHSSTTTGSSSEVGSEDDVYSETVTVVKSYGTCGKETGSTTTKTGSKNKDSASQRSQNSTAASSLLQSNQWLNLARQFQADYEKALLLRTESANVGAANVGARCAPTRSRYRQQFQKLLGDFYGL